MGRRHWQYASFDKISTDKERGEPTNVTKQCSSLAVDQKALCEPFKDLGDSRFGRFVELHIP